MGERFNSAIGGYTCDKCKVLLWAGVKGSKNPKKRRFIYLATPKTIVEKNNKFYCSNQCYILDQKLN